MASEYVARNEELIVLNGDGLKGTYPLGALIMRSAGGSVYETEFGEAEGAVPAVIRIREVESAEAENLEQRLRNVAQLAHPNLLQIYATGSAMLNGVPVFYVVMERAEESLGAVLAERALTHRETREMLVPALEALGYLHKEGYAHSRLRPSNVLAVNDQLKLSTDSLIRLTDAGAAEDMRALGILILQALAQKIPNPDEQPEPQDFEGIPQPLADIVRHCLDPDCTRRWNVEQVKARLNAVNDASRHSVLSDASLRSVVSDASRHDTPAIVAEELSRSEDPGAGGPKLRVAKWIYAGIAALILAVILAAVLRNHSAPVTIPVTAAAQRDSQAPATDPAIADPEGPGATLRAEPPSVAPPKLIAPLNTNPTREREASGWSVIVGAYRSHGLAEKRMREMTKKWPNFEISVVKSQGEKSPYLVVLGRNLSEDQAQALRTRAVQSRLPGDTYIKRLR